MLGAFIATDYVTSPTPARGRSSFGPSVSSPGSSAPGGLPRGHGLAVLMMNAPTPVIDRLVKPRILGRDRKGKPLEIPAK